MCSCWTLTKPLQCLLLVDEAANQSSAPVFDGPMMTFVGNGERKMSFPQPAAQNDRFPSLSAAPALRDGGIMGNNFHGDRWARGSGKDSCEGAPSFFMMNLRAEINKRAENYRLQ